MIAAAVMIAVVFAVHERVYAQEADYYVCQSGCTSPFWSPSSSDLHEVMEDALPGNVIWVAQGTYHPECLSGGIECSFELKNGVSVYGNFIGNENDLDERQPLNTEYESILDGTLGSSAALHVVRADVDGFAAPGHRRFHDPQWTRTGVCCGL